MTLTSHPTRAWLAIVALAALLAGCGQKKDTIEVAARVNGADITVPQIDFVLQQQRGLRPEQSEAAGKQILERLIEHQLALQKAEETKLDRDERVQRQLEGARREVLARAYVERVGEAAAKPSAEDIRKYYNDKPAMFSDRRIYNIQEIGIEARPEQVEELRAKLGSATNINEFIEYLKSAGYRFSGNQAVRTAEQLPPNALDAISKLKDGQAMLMPSPNGAQLLVLAGSRSQPLTEEQARPVIEQYLLAERRRKLWEEELKTLRGPAKIEYVGRFGTAASGVAPK